MSADPQIVPLDQGPSEADQLMADGVEIELAGAPFKLKYDFESLRHIERTFGSLDAFSDAVLIGGDGQMLGMLESGITAGLLHANLPAEVRQQMIEEALGPPIKWERLFDYRRRIVDACVQAGLLTRGDRSDPPADGEAAGEASPGASATTTRRSPSAGRTRSSGA